MEFECQESTTKFGKADNPYEEHVDLNPINCIISQQKSSVIAVTEKAKNLIAKLNGKSVHSSSSGSRDLVLVDDIENLSNLYLLSITDLPPSLISEILNCLEPKDLGVVSCVNTYLYKLAADHTVWKEYYCERWGQPLGGSPVLGPGGVPDVKSWKELFVEKEFRSRTFMGKYTLDSLFGHDEAVRTVFVLASKKLVFTSGYDQTVRMWDMEKGISIASSRPLGCTIRAVAADTRLLVVGGTDGFIHGWRAEEGNPHLFDIVAPQDEARQFRIWEHEGPITCVALDFNRIYSGSWDMSIRIWDRVSVRCLNVLMHNDWVWSLTPHDTTVASTAGSDVYLWDAVQGVKIALMNGVHSGNSYSLARSHAGKLLFTGGEDGTIHMFEISANGGHCLQKVASWIPHTGPVYSLAFEFPWLVSASGDGRLSLIDVRKLLKTTRPSSIEKAPKFNRLDQTSIEPPQRMLHGFGSNLFSVDIGLDRIVCGGEEGVVKIWNFSEALEIEQRVRKLRGLRLENRMRRRRLQFDMTSKSARGEQCTVVARKNQITGDGISWHNKRRVSGKLKA
ncbi:hypothetical protein Leryth_004940 [Lithospermum erythrorhizon]|nr:hypothetical protein Leryth_004940 [Lithospermum erythrorhizon]